MKRNIKIGYIYNILTQLDITAAIWVLYLSFKGMSLVQIGLLESIFHITSLIFELPTGAAADIIGKKFSILIGRSLCIAAAIIMVFSNNFYEFAAAFMIHALSYNFDSGASTALIYDSLTIMDKEKDYAKIASNINFLLEIAQGASMLLGGVLSDIKFIYAYILGIIIQAAALTASAFFAEPCIKDENHEKNSLSGQIIKSIKVLKDKKILLYLVLFSAIISVSGTTVYFYCEKYFSNMHYTNTQISFIFVLASIFAAIFSKLSCNLEKLLKSKVIIIMISLLSILSILGLACTKRFTIMFFVISSSVSGLATPILSEYINSNIETEFRATLLSLDSFNFSLFMIFIFPLIGYIADKTGFAASFGIMTIVLVPVLTFIVLKIMKYSIYDTKA